MVIEENIKCVRGTGMPLGVVKTGRNQWQFSVARKRGKETELLLFHAGEEEDSIRIKLTDEYLIGGVYSVVLTFSDAGICEYLYEINGKSYLDPYVKKIAGRDVFGGERVSEKQVRGCLVDLGKIVGEPLYTPFHQLILYRLHVRGFTMHQSSKVKNKGTFKGVEEKIPYMKSLGINAVLLMPCYDFDELFLEVEKAINQRASYLDYTKPMTKEEEEKQNFPKVNFWGYSYRNSYFAPKASYASDVKNPIREMKNMVKKMHENGISVFMEIFFNHGTPQSFILDCLRYWVREYAIDGFKINTEVVNSSTIVSDPYLSRTKFLATYWNTGEFYDEYEFVEEKTLAEYNDGFMVDSRRFLKSDEGQVNAFINRMRKNQRQQTVINYITNTNGFTLMDLVSYDIKHNEENGENGMDGTEFNYSWNCGWEGPTRKKQIIQLRLRQIKNALLFVLLSQGVPMLLAGDEFGNTQFGNNNAYCQDNEIGWVTWTKKAMNQRIFAFTKKVIALRKAHPVFSSGLELRGMDYVACGFPDISFHGTKPWYPDLSNYSRVFGVMLCGKYAPISIRQSDKSFFLAYNMHWEEHKFELPVLKRNKKWKVVIETNEKMLDFAEPSEEEGQVGILEYMVKPRSVVVFEEVAMKEKKKSKRKNISTQ